MKIVCKNIVFTFDFWILFGFIFLVLGFSIFSKIIDFDKNEYFRFLPQCVFIFFIFYNFIKSIIGIILLIRELFKKQMNIIQKVFLPHILFIIVLVLILCFYRFRLSDPDINYSIIIMGCSISTYRIYQFFVVNLFSNILGLPMWLFNFAFMKDQIKKENKILLNIFTTGVIMFITWLVFFGLTVD